jgi:hypothetical protein
MIYYNLLSIITIICLPNDDTKCYELRQITITSGIMYYDIYLCSLQSVIGFVVNSL